MYNNKKKNLIFSHPFIVRLAHNKMMLISIKVHFLHIYVYTISMPVHIMHGFIYNRMQYNQKSNGKSTKIIVSYLLFFLRIYVDVSLALKWDQNIGSAYLHLLDL